MTEIVFCKEIQTLTAAHLDGTHVGAYEALVKDYSAKGDVVPHSHDHSHCRWQGEGQGAGNTVTTPLTPTFRSMCGPHERR